MFPILQIGPLAIQTPGLALLLGLWLGLTLAEKYTPQRCIAANLLYNLVFVALITGIAGARLAYVIRYPGTFVSSPLGLISLNPGLFDLWGGIVSGIICGSIYAQRRGLEFWNTVDALTPLLAIFAIALGLSNLASGNAFGTPTNLPWGIELWGERRHPTQLYTIFTAGLILVLLWPGNSRWMDKQPGSYFLSFLALSALARLFVEAFRGDSILLPGGFRLAQVIAWIILAGSLWGLLLLSRSPATFLEDDSHG
jgi:phosphatidylglycerol:prolipoprotein diacylglycerol transferase